MLQRVVEVLKEFNPASLSARDLTRITEVLKVFVVSTDSDCMSSTEKQRTTAFKTKNHSGKFLIMSIVVLLRRQQTSGMEGNWVNAILKLLSNNYSKSIARRISFHNKLFRPVWRAEDRVVTANFFEAEKSCVTLRGPDKLFILASEVIKRVRNIGEVLDERSIEVAEAEEAPDVLDGLRGGPFGDTLDFNRIHLDRTVANKDTKILHFALMKFTLLWLEEEVEFFQFVQNVVNTEFMKDVIILCSDDHVIHVDPKPTLCNFLLEDVVHHSLKRGRGISQAEEHNRWFKEAFAGFEGSLVFIAFFNVNVVVTPSNVKLGE